MSVDKFVHEVMEDVGISFPELLHVVRDDNYETHTVDPEKYPRYFLKEVHFVKADSF